MAGTTGERKKGPPPPPFCGLRPRKGKEREKSFFSHRLWRREKEGGGGGEKRVHSKCSREAEAAATAIISAVLYNGVRRRRRLKGLQPHAEAVEAKKPRNEEGEKVQPVSSVLFLFHFEASLAAMREEPRLGWVGTTLREGRGEEERVKGKNHPRAGFTNQSIQPTSLMAGSKGLPIKRE